MIICFLFFSLLMCITLIDLHILKNPCIPRINSTWSWCIILLMCCWIRFASILLRIFASMFISVLACKFPFLWYLSLVLVSGWWWPHRMSLGVFLPLQFFWKVYFFKFYLFICLFWLCWVLVAVCGLSLVAMSRGYCSLWYVGFSMQEKQLAQQLQYAGPRACGLSSCGSWALELRLSSCGALA